MDDHVRELMMNEALVPQGLHLPQEDLDADEFRRV
jgi:hypothetical protein